ncbi:hypothetical protein CFE70_008168 [Pyrenophora teres f. teres 0-1]
MPSSLFSVAIWCAVHPSILGDNTDVSVAPDMGFDRISIANCDIIEIIGTVAVVNSTIALDAANNNSGKLSTRFSARKKSIFITFTGPRNMHLNINLEQLYDGGLQNIGEPITYKPLIESLSV